MVRSDNIFSSEADIHIPLIEPDQPSQHVFIDLIDIVYPAVWTKVHIHGVEYWAVNM